MTQETIAKITALTTKINTIESLANFNVEKLWVDKVYVAQLRRGNLPLIDEPEFKESELQAIADGINTEIKTRFKLLVENYRKELAKLILLW